MDADSAGVPDDWDLQYFGDPDELPSGDWDSDGMSDLHESMAVTTGSEKAEAFVRTELGE